MANSSSQPTATRSAICECGQLIVTVSGEPEHHHACTCTKCQRATGSALSMTAWYPENQIVEITGEKKAWSPDGSGDEATMVYFCPTCGGGGYFKTGAYLPHCIGIRIGSFADPTYPAPPHIHWWPNRPHWLAAPEGVELHEGND